MEIARDICDKDGEILCDAGFVLTENMIDLLKSLNVDSLTVNIEEKEDKPAQEILPPRVVLPQTEFEKHVDKSLSMILHYEEVQQIAEIIKKIRQNSEAAK